MPENTPVDNLTPETPIHVRPLAKGHWFRMDNVVFDRYAELIGATAFGVYAALCRYANNHTQQCYPSAAHLATKLRLTVEEVGVHLEQLQAVGLIYIRKRPGPSPLITLLDPRITEPVVPMPLTVQLAPEPELCPPAVIEKTEPLPAKEDLQKDLAEEKKETQLSSLSSSGNEEKESLVLRTPARETIGEGLPSPCPLSPADTSPYELAIETREAQCANDLQGVRALLAAVWRTEETRQAQEKPAPGCDHEHLNDVGACNDCGEVVVEVPAAAD